MAKAKSDAFQRWLESFNDHTDTIRICPDHDLAERAEQLRRRIKAQDDLGITAERSLGDKSMDQELAEAEAAIDAVSLKVTYRAVPEAVLAELAPLNVEDTIEKYIVAVSAASIVSMVLPGGETVDPVDVEHVGQLYRSVPRPTWSTLWAEIYRSCFEVSTAVPSSPAR